MFDYKLRFETEEEANKIINEVTKGLHPSKYVIYVIGQIKEYIYDETDLTKPPQVIIKDKRWHVDIRLREENKILDAYVVTPEVPNHNFS